MTIFVLTTASPRMRDPDGQGAEPFEKERTITKFYRLRHHADRAAHAMAAKYPWEMFAVFKVDTIYEAKPAEVMEKVVNDAGEVVPKAA